MHAGLSHCGEKLDSNFLSCPAKYPCPFGLIEPMRFQGRSGWWPLPYRNIFSLPQMGCFEWSIHATETPKSSLIVFNFSLQEMNCSNMGEFRGLDRTSIFCWFAQVSARLSLVQGNSSIGHRKWCEG